MSNLWSNFEHQIWKSMNRSGLTDEGHFVLMVSGGIDSMVLLDVLTKVKPRAQFSVLTVHHGPSENENHTIFRQNSVDCVRSAVQKKTEDGISIDFITFRSEEILKSEEQMRNFRRRCIQDFLADRNIPIVTAHHLDDRLETILLKLMRGTSLEGISGFREWDGKFFRPLLSFQKNELLKYAQNWNIDWVDDPSNLSNEYLRNWVRNELFMTLDRRDQSLRVNLAKSLIKIADESAETDEFQVEFNKNSTETTLNRVWFLALSEKEKQRCIALFLRRNKCFNFTAGQIDEIIKRLDNNQKGLTFTIVERKWVIDAMQIVIE